jgi:tetratricopeptide (TPR) repeat protein
VRNLAIDVLGDLAQLQTEAGNLYAAIETLDQALSINPDPTERTFQRQIALRHRLGGRKATHELYRHLIHEQKELCDQAPA